MNAAVLQERVWGWVKDDVRGGGTLTDTIINTRGGGGGEGGGRGGGAVFDVQHMLCLPSPLATLDYFKIDIDKI